MLALAALALAMSGCEKKAPPDPHVAKGYDLLSRDPRAAYEEFRQAKNGGDPLVLLGGGLALEQLRRFEEAEPILEKATKATQGERSEAARLAWVRVRIALGDLEGARRALLPLTKAEDPEHTVLFIASLLAHDEGAARQALAHLKAWQVRALEQQARKAKVPAELHFAHMMLSRQLDLRAEFTTAAKRAELAKLAEPRQALPLVELALQTGREGMALALLRKLHEQGAWAQAQRTIARLALELGDSKLAGEAGRALSGDDFDVRSLRAEIDFALGKAESVASLRHALDRAGDGEARRKLSSLLVEALLRNGKVEQAREEAEQLLADFPGESALVLLARLDLVEERASDALERLAPLLEDAAPSLAVREWAGRAHLGAGNLAAARELLDSVLAERPDHLGVARLRVALEFVAGQPAAAVKTARALVERVPQSTDLRVVLANARLEAEGPESALSSLREGVEARPSDLALRMETIRASSRHGDPAALLADLEKAHREHPHEPLFAAALASQLAKEGQVERAAALYEKLLEEAQGDAVALNNLAMIYADELDQPERAVELAERAHRLSKSPAIVDTLGWALYRRGQGEDRQRARGLLESVQNEFSDPSFRVHLGAVLLATGASEEGKRWLRHALESEHDFAEAELARELLREAP